MSEEGQYASEFIRANRVVRLDAGDAGAGDTPLVGMVDPGNTTLRRRLERYHGRPVRVRRVTEAELLSRLSRLVGERFEDIAPRERAGAAPGAAPGAAAGVRPGADVLSASAPAVEFVNALLYDAVESGATDIHLETGELGARLRYRIDGLLHTVRRYEAAGFAGVVSRLKVLSRVRATERRLPQDGRFSFEAGGRRLDVRTSFLPADRGESVAIRLLDTEADARSLENLGLPQAEAAALRRLDLQAGGLLVVAGPTGSGKTTTAHALLRRWADGTRKVVTVEEPVEYRLRGVTQVHVRREIGLDFDAVLRRALRHDPDVLMIGEVRDPETAALAVRSALSGHPVIATVHAADTAAVHARLENLGVAPHVLPEVIAARVSQRLVRRVCRDCGTARAPGKAERERAASLGVALSAVREGRGCATCRGTGLRGRIGLFRLETAAYRSPSLEAAAWQAVSRGEIPPAETTGLPADGGRG
jgi:general secretion pathway protein E